MSDAQDSVLDALLVLLTDPDQVERNLIKLKKDKDEVRELIRNFEEVKKAGEIRHSQAKQIEDKNLALSSELEVRSADIKKIQDHWSKRDAEQKAEDKKLNEDRLAIIEKDRSIGVREINVKKAEEETLKKIQEIDNLYAQAAQHKDTAGALQKEHQDKLAELDSFLKKAGK